MVALVAHLVPLDPKVDGIRIKAKGCLRLAGQYDALAGDHVDAMTSDYSPLRAHTAFQLLPVAFNDIPVHITPLDLPAMPDASSVAMKRA